MFYLCGACMYKIGMRVYGLTIHVRGVGDVCVGSSIWRPKVDVGIILAHSSTLSIEPGCGWCLSNLELPGMA